ncbi:hypothetical protein BGX21_009412 [Mortierella sp. AD011]|nr:hypothetical protein BGX20_001505 [Mortierella sp. AD010]KAF9396760.1 hypothetical protein BGX21_009412 [Mortierella sp. AD011]
MVRSKSYSVLLMLVATLSLLLVFAPNIVLAQDDDSDTSDTPTISSSPTTAIATPTSTGIMGQGTSVPPTATSTPVLPNPIFTSSDACVACQKEFFEIRNCSTHLPPTGVNLTMIVELLPFYGCLCQNNYVLIDALQQCSSCFRSTGQSAHLNPQFYNVTNQDVKAYKKVCTQTANGSKVPTSGVDRILDTLKKSGSWIILSTLIVILLSGL